jgi:hypothetical protein
MCVEHARTKKTIKPINGAAQNSYTSYATHQPRAKNFDFLSKENVMASTSQSRKKSPSADLEKMQLSQEPQQARMSLEELGASILARTKELKSGLKPSHQFSCELK